MNIKLNGKKFIPLRDYVVGEVIEEKFEITGSKFIATAEELEKNGKMFPTNRLIVKNVGQAVVEKDKVREGAEALFDGRGIELELDGYKVRLLKESNLFGIIEP